MPPLRAPGAGAAGAHDASCAIIDGARHSQTGGRGGAGAGRTRGRLGPRHDRPPREVSARWLPAVSDGGGGAITPPAGVATPLPYACKRGHCRCGTPPRATTAVAVATRGGRRTQRPPPTLASAFGLTATTAPSFPYHPSLFLRNNGQHGDEGARRRRRRPPVHGTRRGLLRPNCTPPPLAGGDTPRPAPPAWPCGQHPPHWGRGRMGATRASGAPRASPSADEVRGLAAAAAAAINVMPQSSRCGGGTRKQRVRRGRGGGAGRSSRCGSGGGGCGRGGGGNRPSARGAAAAAAAARAGLHRRTGAPPRTPPSRRRGLRGREWTAPQAPRVAGTTRAPRGPPVERSEPPQSLPRARVALVPADTEERTVEAPRPERPVGSVLVQGNSAVGQCRPGNPAGAAVPRGATRTRRGPPSRASACPVTRPPLSVRPDVSSGTSSVNSGLPGAPL